MSGNQPYNSSKVATCSWPSKYKYYLVTHPLTMSSPPFYISYIISSTISGVNGPYVDVLCKVTGRHGYPW